MVATFRQPFDLLAETTAITSRAKDCGDRNSSQNDIWLGNLDSNQDRRSQSPLYCRYTIPQQVRF